MIYEDFRIWTGTEYIYSGEMGVVKIDLKNREFTVEDEATPYPFGRVAFEPFSGYKDRRSTKIYCGDILMDSKGRIGRVNFNSMTNGIEVVLLDERWGDPIDSLARSGLEVIGNVHELCHKKLIAVDVEKLIELVKAHVEKDDKRFTDVAYEIVETEKKLKKESTAELILGILQGARRSVLP